MGNRSFSDECKGQILSLDLMLGFVIITVIIGISADAMDIASYKMQDYSSRASLEKLAIDAADVLIKSSGSPGNWEIYGFNQAIIPGLAERDFKTGKVTPNTLSIAKINKLGENYNNLVYGHILPLGVESSMILYPSNNSLSPIVIMNRTPPANVADVTVANRTILLDFMQLKATICGNSTEECPNPDHKANNSTPYKWKCGYFNVSREELDTSDFYLIMGGNVSNSAEWVIDKANCQNSTLNQFKSNPTLVNDKVKELMGYSNKTVLWMHTLAGGNSNNVFDYYIVTVPKGTSPDMVDIKYLNTGPWVFVLEVWR